MRWNQEQQLDPPLEIDPESWESGELAQMGYQLDENGELEPFDDYYENGRKRLQWRRR